jgi:hypothetical protein
MAAITRAPYNYGHDSPLTYADPSGLENWLNLGLPTPGSVATTGAHLFLNAVAAVPYGVYWTSYQTAHAINAAGNKLGLPGQIIAHGLALPWAWLQVVGLSFDAGIDWIKGHTVNNESVCDEGPREKAYLNPFHSYLSVPGEPYEENPPGIHKDGHVDIEW